MAYPRTEKARVLYWQNQIGFTQKKVGPLFEACKILQQQYFNNASTEREASTGDQGGGDEEHIRRTKAGIIFGWIDQSISNMVDRAPVFQQHPENIEAAQRMDTEDAQSLSYAQASAKIINHRYRETNQLRVDDRVALDAFLYPYGVAKLGFTLDMEDLEQEVLQDDTATEGFEDPEDENAFLITGQAVFVEDGDDHVFHNESHEILLKRLVEDQPENLDDLIANIEDHIHWHNRFHKRPEPAANTNVRRGSPWATRWLPDRFLTDSFSMEGPQDARWIAFGWELPLAEVQANKGYKRSVTKTLTGDRWKDAPEQEGEAAGDDDGFNVVRGWEIWARNFPIARGKFVNLLVTIVEGENGKFLQEEEEWPYDRIDDYPVETLAYQMGLESWFHKPPLLMGGGDNVQALVNEILDSYLSIIRKQKNVWLVDPALGIDKRVIQDLLDAPDGSVIEVKGLAEKGAGNAIIPLPFHSIPIEKDNMLRTLQEMFDRSVGTPQPVQLAGAETATEASILERRNTARENRRSSLLSEFQTRKARKMFQLDLQFLPEKLFLIDKQAERFIELTKEMAKGEYLTTMDVTSHSTSLSVERSQWMDLLNLFAGLTPVMMETFGMPPNLPEIARRMLVRGFNEHVVEEILPMLEQASAQMQQGGVVNPAGGAPPGSNGNVVPGAGEFTDPAAAAAQVAVQGGRSQGANINPLDPEAFNRDAPNEGRLEGAGVTA